MQVWDYGGSGVAAVQAIESGLEELADGVKDSAPFSFFVISDFGRQRVQSRTAFSAPQ